MSDDAYRLYRQGLDALAAGHADEAITPLERAKRLEPGSNSIREALGKTYLKVGFYDRAVAEFQVIVDDDPVDAYAHFCLGRAHDRLGETVKARHHYRLATWFSPDRRIYRDTLRAFLYRTAPDEASAGEVLEFDDDLLGGYSETPLDPDPEARDVRGSE